MIPAAILLVPPVLPAPYFPAVLPAPLPSLCHKNRILYILHCVFVYAPRQNCSRDTRWDALGGVFIAFLFTDYYCDPSCEPSCNPSCGTAGAGFQPLSINRIAADNSVGRGWAAERAQFFPVNIQIKLDSKFRLGLYMICNQCFIWQMKFPSIVWRQRFLSGHHMMVVIRWSSDDPSPNKLSIAGARRTAAASICISLQRREVQAVGSGLQSRSTYVYGYLLRTFLKKNLPSESTRNSWVNTEGEIRPESRPQTSV